MLTKSNLIILLVLVIAVLVFFNIFKQHPSVDDSHAKEIKQLQDQIAVQDSLILGYYTKENETPQIPIAFQFIIYVLGLSSGILMCLIYGM